MTAPLILLGVVLVLLALADAPLRRLPMTPALIALVIGLLAGLMLGVTLGVSGPSLLVRHAQALSLIVELVLISSLFAVGLRLLPLYAEWKVALLLAGPGMVVLIVCAMVAAHWMFGLPWPAALLLAAILAPTDPVLASDVQIRSDADRDAVRLSVTAEGGLNDGSAFPAVMLALGLLGLHELGGTPWTWAWHDLLWPLAGGLLVGAGLGQLLGRVVGLRLERDDALARDELLYAGALALGYGLAQLLTVSAFMVAFALGASLLLPLRREPLHQSTAALAERLHVFGRKVERLMEALTVLLLGVLLAGLRPTWTEIAFALLLITVLRPLSVLAVVRRRSLPAGQRRLLAWFGIRGLGSLFYLVFALEHGVSGTLGRQLVSITLICIGMSIVLHGVSSTPLMAAYHRRRKLNRLDPPA